MNPLPNNLDLPCPRCGYLLRGSDGACPECGLDHPHPPALALHQHHRPWLHRLAVVHVAATFGLLVLGGTVTSRTVGLSVPDWPRTYGHNMFLFPPSMWVGGVFWEHSHRLAGAAVGVLCIALTIAIWFTQRQRPWLRLAAAAMLAMVIVQGVVGGLRVTQLSIALAIAHGITGQLFLCLAVLIAAATGRTWIAAAGASPVPPVHPESPGSPTVPSPLRPLAPDIARPLRNRAAWLLLALAVQLTLGATMRHTASGLAIPDFPASYGRWTPPLSPPAISQAVNQLPIDHPIHQQMDSNGTTRRYPSPWQVAVAFAHRVGALMVAALTCWLIAGVGRAAQEPGGGSSLTRPSLLLLVMLIAQLALGASVIWTGRHPEVATAHQAMGAATLATAFLLALRLALLSHDPVRPGGLLSLPASSALPLNARSMA